MSANSGGLYKIRLLLIFEIASYFWRGFGIFGRYGRGCSARLFLSIFEAVLTPAPVVTKSGEASESGLITGFSRFRIKQKPPAWGDFRFIKVCPLIWWRQRDSNPRPPACGEMNIRLKALELLDFEIGLLQLYCKCAGTTWDQSRQDNKMRASHCRQRGWIFHYDRSTTTSDNEKQETFPCFLIRPVKVIADKR